MISTIDHRLHTAMHNKIKTCISMSIFRQQKRRGKNRRARKGLRRTRKLYKRPMLKSLETRRGMDDTYDESFLPLIAKGKRHRNRNKKMSRQKNKDSRDGKKNV